MMVNIRSLLNRELAIVRMSSEWWMEQVCAIVIMDNGILLIALRHVPAALDCHQIGLGHGQCVEVSETQSPVTAIMNSMRKRMAILNGCSLYIKSWPDQKLSRLCAIVGVKKIYYADGSPSNEELSSLKAYCVEVIRVSV